MTNALAATLALIIAILIAADAIWNANAASLFLARRALDVIDILAFWR